LHAVFHNIGVFFGHLADVGWTALAAALACQFTKLCCVSTAWRNIIAASYPDERVPWRRVFAGYVARVGVNAVVPARAGDVAGLYIVKHRVGRTTYPTLASTLVSLTFFDFVAASCFIAYALATGALPGRTVLARLPGFDFNWVFAHLRGTLIVVALVLLVLLLLLLWFAEDLLDFWRRVKQGFLIFSAPATYLFRVVPWQVADWLLRLATIYWFLRAFHVPATLGNAMLVQVTQSLSVLFPISPSGIGTEQALLLYIFRDKAAKTVLLSFSVGMRVTLIAFNALLGFTAIFLTLRTLRWRQRAEADRKAATEASGPP
jgi:uncharacterized membrane protein YbhN (UPF0104 family)